MKNKYDQCEILYITSANTLIQITNFLRAGNYKKKKLHPLASTALEKIKDCDKIFTPPGSETKFKSLIKESY